LEEKLVKEGIAKRPYVIPVGGSNWIGSQGFEEAANELEDQMKEMNIEFSDIVVTCGSGGTVAGLAEGIWKGNLNAKLTAYSVCDSPDYFYDYIENEILPENDKRPSIRELINIKCAKGRGYALSSDEETQFILKFAKLSGIILDPVYTGKTFFSLIRELSDSKEQKSVLFWHTGGSLGTYGFKSIIEKNMPNDEYHVSELLK
jgi:1-aminocyclopropane-1-carboxylate deaminase/D-cysteine desulfhydrase-like pyridoxal-dependent ACC family enzyme